DRLEDPAKNFCIGPHNWVVRISNVRVDGAIVGIDDHFDAVPHICGSIRRPLRVRVSVAESVRVENPLQLSGVSDHQVRIVVEVEEWHRRRRALDDTSAVENLGVTFDVVGEKNLQRSELKCVQHPSEKRSYWNAAPSLVGGVDVRLASGIVELLLPR